MKVKDSYFRTIWQEGTEIKIIDQCKLPHEFQVLSLKTLADMCRAIKHMNVRGAGLIGASAGYGMLLSAWEIEKKAKNPGEFSTLLEEAGAELKATRPTAANLAYAVERVIKAALLGESVQEKLNEIQKEATAIAEEDAEFCRQIGIHGVELIREIWKKKQGKPVNILTHCNAGWLAFVDYGSALSPVYKAVEEGIPVHVWVDETRPRNQGASLTAWELAMANVPHTLIADNTGGHLMQHNRVDMVITGADRVTAQGDAANKIGTYLKALAAKDNAIPFYVALPSSTFDFTLTDGVQEIPIEERNSEEVMYMEGKLPDNSLGRIRICPEETKAMNFAFDVTPSRLITGLITERGICQANKVSIERLFPEKA